MKKILAVSLGLIICFSMIAGCKGKGNDLDAQNNTVSPLPITVDINNLKDYTAAVSLEKGDLYIGEDGKPWMKAKAYAYDLYDMVDIASLKEGDSIIRLGKEVKITKLERRDTGLVSINGGEENGGFDLFTDGSTVYYEIGMSDVKAYYELGEVTLEISKDFVYRDESDLESVKEYNYQDFLNEDENIIYNFSPNNTTVVIQNGIATVMQKRYTP